MHRIRLLLALLAQVVADRRRRAAAALVARTDDRGVLAPAAGVSVEIGSACTWTAGSRKR